MSVSRYGLDSWLDVDGWHSETGLMFNLTTPMSRTPDRRPDIMAIYLPYLQLASCNGLVKFSALAVAVRAADLNLDCNFLGIFTVGTLSCVSLLLKQLDRLLSPTAMFYFFSSIHGTLFGGCLLYPYIDISCALFFKINPFQHLHIAEAILSRKAATTFCSTSDYSTVWTDNEGRGEPINSSRSQLLEM